jgi:hypothetical protein
MEERLMVWFRRSVITRAAALFALALALPVSALAGHGSAGAATLPSVSVNDVSITEGTGGTKTLTFTVNQDARGKSRVSFATTNDTARAPADYIARSGTLRFAGKKLKRTVSVTIVGDSLDEADETFFLKLTGASGATIDDGEGVGTITDDDAPPDVAVPSTLSVPEGQNGDTIASIDVSLSAPSGQEVTVDWATADGTAMEADSDYTGDSGTLQFAPGETDKAILVTVIGDVNSESDETFTLTLSSPTNANLGNAIDTVTIVDNDPLPTGVPIFDVSNASKREGASGNATLTFTVTRSDDTATPVTVDYVVSNGTAVAPSDFAAVAPGTFSFGASETTKTLDVTIKGDRRLEHDETLFLTLDAPSAGAIDDGQGKGTIVNDDTKTGVAVRVRAAKHRVAVHGRVSPARARKHAVVRFFRKRNGGWVLLHARRPILRGRTDSNNDGFSDSRYETSFRRAKRGRCKMIASYPGDAHFSRSTVTKLFRC